MLDVETFIPWIRISKGTFRLTEASKTGLRVFDVKCKKRKYKSALCKNKIAAQGSKEDPQYYYGVSVVF